MNGTAQVQCVECPFSSWGDCRRPCAIYKYIISICSAADGTPSTKRFHSTSWSPSTLGPDRDRVSEYIFSKWTGWDGPIPWPPRLPDITTLDFSFGTI
jgi:hypothetical protein